MMRLPLCRLRQITELISQRQQAQTLVHAKMFEWQTQQLASIIASTSELTKEGRTEIVKSIKSMALVPDEVDPLAPPTEDEIASWIEGGSPTAADDPRNARAGMWAAASLSG